jgi:hypothetical protein
MAIRSYSLTRGQTEFQVTEAATGTINGDIEVRIDQSKGWTMAEVQQALNEYLANFILKNASGQLTP